MKPTSTWAVLLGSLALLLSPVLSVRSEEIPAEYRATIAKGLEWMAKNQHKDGHWEAFGGQYPMTMTGIGGMSLLMEGSTIREGKYRDNIRRAVDWLMSHSMPNGMLGNPNMPGEAGRYMYGHGFSLMFLSCVYGEEEEGDRRKKLEDILTRAAQFSRDAQTRRKARTGEDIGGWGYMSAKEGNNFDEGSVTVTQVQALRAARNAGIKVPPEAIREAIAYLDVSTNSQGGVIYSLGGGGGGDGRPALTAAAIACGFSSGDYHSPLVKKWFKFCQQNLGGLGGNRFGHDEYTHYYYAQGVYILGEDGYGKLFPESSKDERLTWSKYRKSTFENLVRTQAADGSWSGGHVGPIFITAVHLTIMQLDGGVLPLYQR
jgi:Prenyltransferase and squalene oxidase repeat